MRKPKTAWQIAVKMALERLGMTYKELAEEVGTSEDYVKLLMCANGRDISAENSRVKKVISDYLEV
jgi:predicted transcriptional regulator